MVEEKCEKETTHTPKTAYGTPLAEVRTFLSHLFLLKSLQLPRTARETNFAFDTMKEKKESSKISNGGVKKTAKPAE